MNQLGLNVFNRIAPQLERTQHARIHQNIIVHCEVALFALTYDTFVLEQVACREVNLYPSDFAGDSDRGSRNCMSTHIPPNPTLKAPYIVLL